MEKACEERCSFTVLDECVIRIMMSATVSFRNKAASAGVSWKAGIRCRGLIVRWIIGLNSFQRALSENVVNGVDDSPATNDVRCCIAKNISCPPSF